MKPSILKWGMYAVQTIVVIEIIAHASLVISLVVILLVAATGMANYLLGWHARERAIPRRDPGVEKLRGRACLECGAPLGGGHTGYCSKSMMKTGEPSAVEPADCETPGWKVTPNPDGTLIWEGPDPPPCSDKDVWFNPTEERTQQ